MELRDRWRQLEDVEKDVDTGKEEKSINMYSMCGQVEKMEAVLKVKWNYTTAFAHTLRQEEWKRPQ